MSKASTLCLLTFILLNSHHALSFHGPKLPSEAAKGEEKQHNNNLAPVIEANMKDDLSSINKINPEKNSMIAGFYSHNFPIKAWPFPKYPHFPEVKPIVPSVPTNPSGSSQDLSSSPSKGKGNGGIA